MSQHIFLVVLSLSLILAGCAPTIYENNQIVSTPTAVDSVEVSDPSLKESGYLPPQQVTENFYDWYLTTIGESGNDTFRNPLVDKAYHDSPYLTDSFVGYIDDLLDNFESEFGGAGYDPFFCAQAIPTEMTPDVTFEHHGITSVVVRSSFPNHMITVDLQPDGDSWRISNITCANDPAGTATAFYTWYLGYIGDRSSGDFRNPLVDQAYHDHPLLTDSWVQTVDETLAGFEHGGSDPFLLAQDIPQDFSVDPGLKEGTAVVHLQFSSDSVKHLRVTMDETGRKIAKITEDGRGPASVDDEDDASLSPLNMSNPAAVFCEEQGYTYEIRQNEDGSQYGVCILDDGSECDGWAFFNGSCPDPEEGFATTMNIDLSNWVRYTNTEFGYTLLYPPECEVMVANKGHMVSFIGPLENNKRWPMIIISHGNSNFYRPPAGSDVQEWIMGNGHHVSMVHPDATLGGLPALHLSQESSPQVYASDDYYVIRGEQLFHITLLHTGGRQDWTLYEAFLDNFSFDMSGGYGPEGTPTPEGKNSD